MLNSDKHARSFTKIQSLTHDMILTAVKMLQANLKHDG